MVGLPRGLVRLNTPNRVTFHLFCYAAAVPHMNYVRHNMYVYGRKRERQKRGNKEYHIIDKHETKFTDELDLDSTYILSHSIIK